MTAPTTCQPYHVASHLKTLCDDAHAATEVVAERIDDHFLQAELVQFSHQLRQISIDLRKALYHLDAPADLRVERRVDQKQWDTALTLRERYDMVLAVEGRVKILLDALRSALTEALPRPLEETVQQHYVEVKQIARQLRVMREMVNPY